MQSRHYPLVTRRSGKSLTHSYIKEHNLGKDDFVDLLKIKEHDLGTTLSLMIVIGKRSSLLISYLSN